MKKWDRIIALGVLLGLAGGCTEIVPAGHKGQVQLPGGWSKKLSPPGRVTCYHRDVLWLAEWRDVTQDTTLNILLETEQVNFGVTISLTYTLSEDDEQVLAVFDKVRPTEHTKIIPLESVFDTYARPIINSVPRQVIRPYTTEQLLSKAAQVEEELQSAVIEAMKDTPITVRRVSLTNMDFPEFITKAQERAKEAEIKIREEQNRQKMRMVEAENRQKIAEMVYEIKMLEAKAISDQNRLIGESLAGPTGEQYLRWHEIRVYGEAAAGPNNCIFLPMNILGAVGHEAAMTPLRGKLRKAMEVEE